MKGNCLLWLFISVAADFDFVELNNYAKRKYETIHFRIFQIKIIMNYSNRLQL
jgi:hypothetical protein